MACFSANCRSFCCSVEVFPIKWAKAFSCCLSGNWGAKKGEVARICSAPFNDMYDPADMPPAVRDESELDDEHPYKKLMHANAELLEDRDLRETQANYYGMITEVDTCLGVLFDALESSGQWEDTLIVFSSDHGEYLGDHYLTGKGHIYDQGMRVPLIIRDPRSAADVTRGETLGGFVESVDIAPTILDLLELPIPDRVQGQSLAECIRGPGGDGKSEIHYEKDFRHVKGLEPDRCLLWVVRDDRYKYIHFANPSMPALLFDLQSDPSELVDIAGRPESAPIALEYAGRLIRWRMENEDQRMEHWASQYK